MEQDVVESSRLQDSAIKKKGALMGSIVDCYLQMNKQ